MKLSRHGFTLMELIAVVTIMGILMLAIVPSMDSMLPKYRLRSGGRNVAAMVELGQSAAITNRTEHAIAYDLDAHTYWLVLPLPPEEDPEPEESLFGFGEEETPPGQRPVDDVEHGPPPPDPNLEPEGLELSATDMVDRDNLEPTRLPEGVEFYKILLGDEEKTSGTVYIPFSHLGNEGAHVVGVRLSLEESPEQTELWVKFNALSRTIEYHDEEPQIRTLEGSSQ